MQKGSATAAASSLEVRLIKINKLFGANRGG